MPASPAMAATCDVAAGAPVDTPGGARLAATAASDAAATAGPAPEENPLVSRVRAAIEAGAGSWSAVGRAVGVSRQWACHIGTRAGLSLAGGAGAREVTLSVRVRASALARVDELAAAESEQRGRPVKRSEMVRQLLAEALNARA